MVVKFGDVCVGGQDLDGPLMDHIRQFCCYFSYLFELNIQYNVFKKYHFYAIYMLYHFTNLII